MSSFLLSMRIVCAFGRRARWLLGSLLFAMLAACGGGSDADVAPTITAEPADITLAAGSELNLSVTATGTAPMTYQWRRDGIDIGAATDPAFRIAAVTETDNGARFSVLVSNAAGSATSTAATLTVTAAVTPTILTPPTDAQTVAGASATFRVVATGSAPLAYQWQRNGVPLAGATDASYATAATTVANDDGARYAVTVSNAAGSTISTDAMLTVTAAVVAPTVVTPPTDTAVNVGEVATFRIAAAGSGPLAYQWRRNGVDVAGAVASTYATAPAAATDDGATFSVLVSNPAGSVRSSVATLSVSAAVRVPVITVPPASVRVSLGSIASFTATATGSAPLAFQWLRDGVDIAGATGAAYVTPRVSAADNGALFSVRASNAAGTALSAPATLSISGVAPGIVTAPANVAVAAPAPATFRVVASGTAPLSYQWRRDGVAIVGATGASYSTGPTSVASHNGARYSVDVSNGVLPNARSTSATLTVTAALVAPSITTGPASATATVGAAATFRVVATGSAPLSYQWRRNGVAIAGATGASYTTPPTASSDDGARYGVVVSNGTPPDATSGEATLTVQSTWTGVRQDGAPFPAGTSAQVSRAVATDARGNVVIGGATTGAFSGLTAEGSPTPFIAKYGPAGGLLWARLVLDGRNSFGATESVKGVAVDSAGNIYVTGETLTAIAGETAVGGYDIFVAKFDPAGNRLWLHQFGSPSNDTANGIAVDSRGNAYLVGWSRDQLPGQAPPYNEDYFIAKYDTDGVRLWLHQADFTPANPDGDEATGVAVDAAGNAYVSGMRGANNGALNPTAIYVVKYAPTGTLLWTGSLSTPSRVTPMRSNGIAVSADGGAVYLTGWTYADFDVVNNPPVAPLCCTQGDAFVAKFDGVGTLLWAHNLSSQTLSGPRQFDDEAYAIATDPGGTAVYVTGYTSGVMPGESSKGAEDIFVARYGSDGIRSWVRQLGAGSPAAGTLNDRAYGAALDANGDLFITGTTLGTFGTPGRHLDRNDWFVLKMNADGSLY
jgi:Beta-propeller repeat